MRTKQLFVCFGMLSTLGAVSQPVINFGDLTPTFGGSFTTTNASYVEPGEGGANQVWDLSEMEAMESYTMHFEAPNGQPGLSGFPSASHVVVGDDGNTYGYMAYAGNRSELLGFVIPTEGISMVYSNPRMEMEFPLSLNASFDDIWESEVDLGNNIVNIETGSSTATVDGYGTLITPAGTYTDVLRIKYEASTIITTYMDGTEIFSTESSEETYVFVKSGISTTLASLGSLTMDGETNYDADYLSDQTLGSANVNVITNLSVYPNPANTFVETAFQLETSTVLNTALYSLDGRLIHIWTPQQFAAGSNQLRFDLPHVVDGIYLLQIATATGTHSEKITVQR